MHTPTETVLPSGIQWHLSAGGYEATVVEVGGGLRTLRHDGLDLVAGYESSQMADAARGHVLAPWPNRIAGGEYRFADEIFRLPWNEPALANASHGLVQWAPWACVEAAGDAVTLGVTIHPQPGWAWTLRLELTYALGPDGLTVTPRATNLSSAPCPFGFGMHPYLTAGEATLDDVTLTLPARTRLDVDDRLIPSGRIAADPSFARGLLLDGVALDTCFTDLDAGAPAGAGAENASHDRRWAVTVATSERSTTLWADAAAYPFVQTFTGDGLPEAKRRRSGLAVEPMTCAADAFNSGDGLLVLQPGETWSAPFGIRAS